MLNLKQSPNIIVYLHYPIIIISCKHATNTNIILIKNWLPSFTPFKFYVIQTAADTNTCIATFLPHVDFSNSNNRTTLSFIST